MTPYWPPSDPSPRGAINPSESVMHILYACCCIKIPKFQLFIPKFHFWPPSDPPDPTPSGTIHTVTQFYEGVLHTPECVALPTPKVSTSFFWGCSLMLLYQNFLFQNHFWPPFWPPPLGVQSIFRGCSAYPCMLLYQIPKFQLFIPKFHFWPPSDPSPSGAINFLRVFCIPLNVALPNPKLSTFYSKISFLTPPQLFVPPWPRPLGSNHKTRYIYVETRVRDNTHKISSPYL